MLYRNNQTPHNLSPGERLITFPLRKIDYTLFVGNIGGQDYVGTVYDLNYEF